MSNEEAASSAADTVDAEAPSGQRIGEHDDPESITLERITRMAIFAVCGWSLIETPWEIGGSHSTTSLLALAAAKLIVILTTTGAIAKVRVVRAIFALICGTSVLAIAPTLPFIYAQSVELAVMSTVECVLKVAVLVAFYLSSLQPKRPGKQS